MQAMGGRRRWRQKSFAFDIPHCVLTGRVTGVLSAKEGRLQGSGLHVRNRIYLNLLAQRLASARAWAAAPRRIAKASSCGVIPAWCSAALNACVRRHPRTRVRNRARGPGASAFARGWRSSASVLRHPSAGLLGGDRECPRYPVDPRHQLLYRTNVYKNPLALSKKIFYIYVLYRSYLCPDAAFEIQDIPAPRVALSSFETES
jgi:hypothetical protein